MHWWSAYQASFEFRLSLNVVVYNKEKKHKHFVRNIYVTSIVLMTMYINVHRSRLIQVAFTSLFRSNSSLKLVTLGIYEVLYYDELLITSSRRSLTESAQMMTDHMRTKLTG